MSVKVHNIISDLGNNEVINEDIHINDIVNFHKKKYDVVIKINEQ